MTSKHMKQTLFAVGAFLAAWQATDFGLDYRHILGAVTAAILGAANPSEPVKPE